MTVSTDFAGEWSASVYSLRGGRRDYQLLLNPDGSYRQIHRDGEDVHDERGRWHYRPEEETLRFEPDSKGEQAMDWAVSAIRSFEDSNLLLVLRRVMIASVNLPIVYYRTGWPAEHSAATA